jgi:hypothetical protein
MYWPMTYPGMCWPTQERNDLSGMGLPTQEWDDLPKNVMTYPGMRWSTQERGDLSRNGMTYPGMGWPTQEWDDLPRNAMTYPGMWWPTQECDDLPRNAMTYQGMWRGARGVGRAWRGSCGCRGRAGPELLLRHPNTNIHQHQSLNSCHFIWELKPVKALGYKVSLGWGCPPCSIFKDIRSAPTLFPSHSLHSTCVYIKSQFWKLAYRENELNQ